MRISVCVGDYAKRPYCVPGVGINAYCMEELSYLIKENAYLLDTSLMEDRLLGWIEEECGRRELARRLYPLVHKNGSLSLFVTAILEDTGFYDRQSIEEVSQVLKQGAGLTRIEKRKGQVDRLLQKKKYASAIREYDRLLMQWNVYEKTGVQLPPAACRAAILHNKGMAMAGLMLYAKAAECFEQAWKLEGDKSYGRDYLAAKRLELPEEAYVAFAAGHTELYEETLALEKEIEELTKQWEQQPEFLLLNNRRELRENGQLQKYDEENEKLTQALKESYRNSVTD